MDLSNYRTRRPSHGSTSSMANQRTRTYTLNYLHRMVKVTYSLLKTSHCISLTFLLFKRHLFLDFRFLILFLASAIATFPLFVPPFFLPLYSTSLHLYSSTGAGLVAGFNFASAIGRLCCGLLSDSIGPLNTLFLSLILSAASMLALWPVSSTLAPLVAFVVINGAANGGFFATMPTVVGSVFGSARVSVAMGMIVTGWGGGYLMVCIFILPLRIVVCGSSG